MKKISILPLVLGAVWSGTVLASYGCDEDNNDAVVAELALCSTHAYNIGEIQNPKDPSSKQLMDDVVAMKTTVITQQLYRQYEQLESMMARFKTQLEKAVLENKLGAAGAKSDDDDDSDSYRSNDGYTILSGTMNCRQQVANGQANAINCLKNNLNYVINAANSGNTSDARKQLTLDLSAAKTILGNKINVSDGSYDTSYYLDCTITEKKVSGGSCDDVCKKVLNGETKKSADVANCAYTVLGIINTAENDIRRAEMRLSQPSYRY